jgi:L-threonylcarbamoyladenylate synthase
MKKIYSIIKRAKKYLVNNGIIAIPTETVYGLAGNAYSDKSVKKIFFIKKRPLFNPLIVHYAKINDLKKDCYLNENFKKLYKKFCPGPLTFILKKRKNSKLSNYVNSNKKTVAVRFPNHNITKKLLQNLDFPLAAPSANMSSKLSAVTAVDVREEFKKKINFIIDGGKSNIGVESTIIDLVDKPIILRPGGLEIEKIKKILKVKIKIKSKIIKSPGQLDFHYSPGIPVRINVKTPKKNEAFIQFSKKINKKNYFYLSKKGNIKEAAKELYSLLRLIKNMKYKSIAVSRIPKIGLGLAINDRLNKASYK